MNNPAVLALLCLPFIAVSVQAAPPAQCSAFKIDGHSARPLGQMKQLAPGGCAVRYSHGLPIPDPACTPGAVNPQITVDVLQHPLFRTRCVRDNGSTPHEKAKTYHYYDIPQPQHNTGSSQTCELDHLISLELGGADTLENIWPQCGPGDSALRERYFKLKDKVENYLARQVREGTMRLEDAQRGIAEDWTQYLEAAQQHKHRRPSSHRAR